VIALAPEAKSWFLADETNDGVNGINTQVGLVFQEAIDAIVAGEENVKGVAEILLPDLQKVLSQYGIRVR